MNSSLFISRTRSPPCRAVLLAAAALDIQLTLKEVDIRTRQQFSAEFLRINPQHTVPAFEENGFCLSESRAIMQYLANAYGKNSSVYPKDPKERAIVDHRLFFDLECLQHEFAEIYYPAMFTGVQIEEAKLAKLTTGLEFLSGFLEKSKFSAGDNLTLADFSIVTTLSSLEAVGYKLSNFPKVITYYANCRKEMKDYDLVNSKGFKLFSDMAKVTLKLNEN